MCHLAPQADLEQGDLYPAQFAEGLEEVVAALELAANCLSVEPAGTYRRSHIAHIVFFDW